MWRLCPFVDFPSFFLCLKEPLKLTVAHHPIRLSLAIIYPLGESIRLAAFDRIEPAASHANLSGSGEAGLSLGFSPVHMDHPNGVFVDNRV